MLDLKTQSQLVDATATIMRSYVRAATNTFAASAWRSVSLWSEMLEAASPHHASAGQPQPVARPLLSSSWPSPTDWMATSRLGWAPLVRAWWVGPSVTFWAPLADWNAWSSAPFPTWSGWLGQVPLSTADGASNGATQGTADDGGFSSYRSSGGHATTRVIMGAAPSQTNGRAAPPKRS